MWNTDYRSNQNLPALPYGINDRGRRKPIQKLSQYYEKKKDVDKDMEDCYLYSACSAGSVDGTQCCVLSGDTLVVH